MTNHHFFCAGITRATHFAMLHLSQDGFPISDIPEWNTRHLLLDVPSDRPGSILRNAQQLDTLLGSLPHNVTIWGGNLTHPKFKGFHTQDLLADERYLFDNARITAQCALKLALPLLTEPPAGCPVLIIGWGRIGKHLTTLLQPMGYPLTVAARKESAREHVKSCGSNAIDLCCLPSVLPQFRLIFNTVPDDIISEEHSALCSNCIKMDLASHKGISGEDVIWARGLPGIHAPEQSGILIAQTILRLIKEEEQ